MSQAKMVEMDIPMDQYKFERMKYACEKAGKDLGDTLQIFLARKVVPTSDRPKTDPKKKGA